MRAAVAVAASVVALSAACGTDSVPTPAGEAASSTLTVPTSISAGTALTPSTASTSPKPLSTVPVSEPEASDTAQGSTAQAAVFPPVSATGGVARWTVEIIESHSHDPEAFTQGLEAVADVLYESTGLWGRSSLRKVDPSTGEVTARVELSDDLFGEGLTVVGDHIVQLTWQSGRAIVYDRHTLAEVDSHRYEGEGWGLCLSGDELVMSDGSNRLAWRDPATFELLRRVTVTAENYDGRLDHLNELECVDGLVIANVWQTAHLLVINPFSGRVVAVIDAGALVARVQAQAAGAQIDVLNGVAAAGDGSLWMTGKLWPELYRVRIVEASESNAAQDIASGEKWTLLAGGDVLMDRTEPADIDPFALLSPQLSSADVALVNVEMAISDQGSAADKRFVFRAPPSAAVRIAAGGVDVVTLANNHAKDYGSVALLDTVEQLEAAGVVTVGAGRNTAEAHRHRVLVTDNGVRVAFVGASLIVPAGFAAGSRTPGIASAYAPGRDRVLDSVRAAAGDGDVVIATVHWGIERDTCPSGAQELLARELLAAGADVVIGHHPHVLQPVVFEEGGLVAYSLGNFVWHPRSGHTGETGVLQVDFDGGDVIGWSFHPHLLNGEGVPAPSGSGPRFERINDIISGDCARHDPPPPSYATTRLPPPTATAGISN